ncbi:uncharacterized protein LOC109703623 isoform X2 [Ananas comosus]|uniref:Uncharacterized protein LOC109703623 isoform X2 n=1 Tax=Ananas comosus TaxID=4615 RepID=A0A6P5EE16_ANACO|nr:uncharacterized protein LOC109703623 isoform X2 [Ananas comosus]
MVVKWFLDQNKDMAADSNMGFHQGFIPSSYCSFSPHMVSFQTEAINSSTGMISRAMSMNTLVGTSTSSGMFIPARPSLVSNMPSVSPSASSSTDASLGSMPKYKFVTGSPADWTLSELAILKEGLVRYAHEPNIMKYIKIAAMLPTRTIRDVALRCRWNISKEGGKRRKPEEHSTGKKMKDLKGFTVSSTSTVNIHPVPSNNVAPYSFMMHQPNQSCLEVPAVDSATLQLLEENDRFLNQISASIATFKVKENPDLFLHTSNNITAILDRMSRMPGIMSQMPPLPVSVDEQHLSSIVQLSRMGVSYGAPIGPHLKQEPRC